VTAAFANSEEVKYDGSSYISYSKHKHDWSAVSPDASVCFVAQDVIPSKSAVERMPAAILLSVFITVLLLLIRISVYYAINSCKVNEQKPEKCLPNVIILSKISK
jgi:hypothetical protein